MKPSFDMRIAVVPDVMFRTVGEESVLLHLKTETYMGLDPVGTRMWTLLTQSDSIEDAYQALLREYDVESQQLRRDLEDFIAKLIENDLVLLDGAETLASGA
jgi:hypothetical protein